MAPNASRCASASKNCPYFGVLRWGDRLSLTGRSTGGHSLCRRRWGQRNCHPSKLPLGEPTPNTLSVFVFSLFVVGTILNLSLAVSKRWQQRDAYIVWRNNALTSPSTPTRRAATCQRTRTRLSFESGSSSSRRRSSTSLWWWSQWTLSYSWWRWPVCVY